MTVKALKRFLLVALAVSVLAAVVAVPASAGGFDRGPVVLVEGGVNYYLAPQPVPGGGYDIPGHYWVIAGKNKLVGHHYNTNEFWSPDAGEGTFLYVVDARIDLIDTPAKEAWYKSRGFVHKHHLVDGSGSPYTGDKSIVLKHTARTSFTFQHGGNPRSVTPGIDWGFMPNW